ncbi:MAG: plasmid pRiA4b ORF-3 family protein [Rubrivivax sp.]|nr:plasmid pRiA4b ORF-3 family protein [Rubrivivax sp.]MDP3612350.1 plasmid pRiA4b ORF-3 family protein [Rubrivivax sp.]
MSKTSPKKPGASAQAYQLYIELEDVRPTVWRRFLVPVTVELPSVHTTILFGMGWQGGHIHEFFFGHDSYGCKDPPFEPDFEDVMDEAGVSLREALGGRKTFIYVYDYGDNWRHKIKVEKVVALDTPIDRSVCIGGENACPPEDVGGAPGYEEFLEALRDPSHPEHEHLTAWIGGAFDPAAFDVEDVNVRLSPSEY